MLNINLKSLRKSRRIIFCMLGGGVILFWLFYLPGETLSVQMDLELGFEGQYITGNWTPLHILLENQESSLEGTLQVGITKKDILGESSVETIYSIPVSLPSSSRKVYQINVLLESTAHSLHACLVSEEKTILEKKIKLDPLYQEQKFILVINRTQSGFDFLNPSDDKRTRRVLYSSVGELPGGWAGYDSIRALIIDNVSSFDLSFSQQQAVKKWLSRGGTLVLTPRGGYGKFKSQFLRDLLPLQYLEKTHIFTSSLSSLQRKYGSFEEKEEEIEVWDSRWEGADILYRAEDVPLLVKLDEGQGEVIFFAFDFLQPPFRRWSGLSSLWADVLGKKKDFSSFPRGILDPLVTDSCWQGELSPEREKIIFFILPYLACVIVLFSWQRIRKRPSIMYASLIGVMVIFIVLSCGLGGQMKEDNTSLRTVSICYGQQNSSFMRAENYLVFFCPHSQQRKLTFDRENALLSAVLMPQRRRIFSNLVIYPHQERISWNASSLPWSFYLLRLETVFPVSLHTRINREGESIQINLQNSNSFVLEDLLLVYNSHSCSLEQLAPSDEKRLMLNLESEESSFSLSKYLQEIGMRRSSLEAKLRKSVFQHLWEFEGPLRKLADQSPVLVAWFTTSPEEVVRYPHQRIKRNFTGLLIMPLEVT